MTGTAQIRVVGAGLGRTGTHSLKVALERLLGAPCYHMIEVFAHPEHVPAWQAAADGAPVDWDAVFDGYVATVDWPGAAVWQELADTYPDALVLLSTRENAAAWWRSASRTVLEALQRVPPSDSPMAAWHAMVVSLLRNRFTPDFLDEESATAAYDRFNAEVRATVPPSRLVEWQPGDGWEPLCAALGVAVPDEPFPLTNTTAEFRAMLGLDP